MKLCISKKVFEKLNLKVGVIIAKGINNKGKVNLPKASAPLSDPKVNAWKEAYKKLGVDPEKYQPSIVNIVNLGKKGLPKINKLVDIYNYISLKHVLPVGGSDLSKIKGNIFIREADKQPFTALNSKNVEYTKPGELVYSDEEKIITRRLNWKESDFTKFTEDTKNAILELEAIPPMTDSELTVAVSELAKLIEEHCGGQVNYFILDKSYPTLDVDLMNPSDEFVEHVVKEKEVEQKNKTLTANESVVVSMLSKLVQLNKNQIGELLETPPDSKLGDLAFPCFTLSPILRKDPKQIAEELAKKIDVKSPFKEVKVVGPYLNFFLDQSKLAKDTILKVEGQKDKYGSSSKFKGKQVIIDMIGLNPNKAGHVGHIKTGSVGDSVARLMSAVGFKTVKQTFVNDMGVPTSMVFWAVKNIKSKLPKKAGLLKKEDQWQGRVYDLMMNLTEKDPKIKEKVNELHSVLESGKNAKLVKEQRKLIEACLAGQSKTWTRMHASLDLDLCESDIVRSGMLKCALDLLKKSGVAYVSEESEDAGALKLKLSHLDYFKGMTNPDKILVRPDGRSTYTGKDIALQLWRFGLMPDFEYKLANLIGTHKEWSTDTLNGKKINLGFNKNTHNVTIIGAEQKYVIAVDFYALYLLGHEAEFKNCYHLAPGLVGFGGKAKISSREGTSGLTADEVLDKASALALKEVKKRNPKLSITKQKQLAEAIGSSAIRYHMLKVDATKFVQFDFDEALSLEGNTGPYLQYALVRAKKILKKAKPAKSDLSLLTDPAEFELVKHIASFPQTVEQAAEQYSPHLIANYAHELAQLFSTFYEKCPVLKAEPKLKAARLSLVKAFAQTLKNALNLLGVEAVELM